jgi:hypothetical protein
LKPQPLENVSDDFVIKVVPVDVALTVCPCGKIDLIGETRLSLKWVYEAPYL